MHYPVYPSIIHTSTFSAYYTQLPPRPLLPPSHLGVEQQRPGRHWLAREVEMVLRMWSVRPAYTGIRESVVSEKSNFLGAFKRTPSRECVCMFVVLALCDC